MSFLFANLNDRFLNNLNTTLMLVSVMFAFLVPFELFMFSFVILGPLHYLTELSWLEKKRFFTSSWFDIAFLVISAIVILVFSFVFPKHGLSVTTILISLTFIYAFGIIFIKHLFLKMVFLFISFFAIFFLGIYKNYWFIVIFSIFLTTIIHTTIFTFIFILSGIRKKMTPSGIISLAVFFACSIGFFIIPLPSEFYKVTNFAKDKFGFFIIVNQYLASFIHFGNLANVEDVFYSKEGIAIMRYIAFAYTYHYLNWFTKTSVIKWHEVSKQRLYAIAAVYVILVSFYFYDMQVGVTVIYVIALWHSLLEFPLNHLAFVQIFKKN